MSKLNKVNLKKYYDIPEALLTKKDTNRLNWIIAMHLRLVMTEAVLWERNTDNAKYGLFEFIEPYEEGERLIHALQLFGYIECAPEEPNDQP